MVVTSPHPREGAHSSRFPLKNGRNDPLYTKMQKIPPPEGKHPDGAVITQVRIDGCAGERPKYLTTHHNASLEKATGCDPREVPTTNETDQDSNPFWPIFFGLFFYLSISSWRSYIDGLPTAGRREGHYIKRRNKTSIILCTFYAYSALFSPYYVEAHHPVEQWT